VTIAAYPGVKVDEMKLNRARLPCPACGKPIVLSLSKTARYDFQVGCMECKTISHSAELLSAMKANDATARDLAEERSRPAGGERAE